MSLRFALTARASVIGDSSSIAVAPTPLPRVSPDLRMSWSPTDWMVTGALSGSERVTVGVWAGPATAGEVVS
jgi:hypothetical protein